MKRLLSVILLLVSVYAYANDGVYFTSGNMLVPMRESTISVRKEILTITIGKDSLAKVDVYYEFFNPDSTKTVAMAFEATAPYNADFDIVSNNEHPYIHDFKVVMNGEALNYKNMPIVSKWENANKISNGETTPLDTKEWKRTLPKKHKEYEMPNLLYNATLDSIVYFDYGYMFDATFKPGINKVHHTYSYNMSYGIGDTYTVQYWLTPATRWANHQIDDFTFRIKNENKMDYCISYDSAFSAVPFHFAKGNGRIYPFTDEYGVHNTLIAALGEDAVLEWHSFDFAPKTDICIHSIDNFINTLNPNYRATKDKVVVTADGGQCRFIGYCGNNYLVDAQDYGLIPMNEARVEVFSAKAGQGIVTIRNKDYKKLNVRKEPSTNSKVVAKICDTPGELPVVLKCLGLVDGIETNAYGSSDYHWFKVEVNGKIGYIREDLMMWDSIDSY